MGRLSRTVATGLSLGLAVVMVAGSVATGSSKIPTSSSSTFRLNPGQDRVDVSVQVTVTNRMPNSVTARPCPGSPSQTCRTTTRWFTDSYGYFWVGAGARKVRFTGPGVKAHIDHKQDGYTFYVVAFAPIYQGQSRTFKVTYQMPAARPRSPNMTRITDAYAHFCWHGQATDRGTVTAVLPRAFEPVTHGSPISQKRTKKAVELKAKRKTNLARFHACTDSFKPEKLVRTETETPSGRTVVVEGWPEDPEWAEAVTSGLERTLSSLEEIAGTPIPSDPTVIRQVAAQALHGYGGDFTAKSDQIRVGEKYDDPLLIAHELAHAWFSTANVRDVWISEGHAEWMANQARWRSCYHPGEYPGKGKPKLSDWRYLSLDSTKREREVVDYQYEAACRILQEVETEVGTERMADLNRALLQKVPKYDGSELKRKGKIDWREWLDAVDEVVLVPAGVEDLRFAEALLLEFGAVKSKQLKGRAEARSQYHEALSGSLAEYMPVAIRDLMDGWRFDRAMQALPVAEGIIERAANLEETLGSELLGTVGPLLREARSIEDLKSLRRRLRADPTSFASAEPDETEVEPEAAEAT